jgi:hypothetical protein
LAKKEEEVIVHKVFLERHGPKLPHDEKILRSPYLDLEVMEVAKIKQDLKN